MPAPIPTIGESTYQDDFIKHSPLSARFLDVVQAELECLEPLLRDDTTDPTIFGLVMPRSDARSASNQLRSIEDNFPALKLCVAIVLDQVVYPPAQMLEVALLGYRAPDTLKPHIDRRKEVVSLVSLKGIGTYITYVAGPFSEFQPKLEFDDTRLVVKEERQLEPGSLLVTNGDCEPEVREPHSMVTHTAPRFVLVVRQVVEHPVYDPDSPEFAAAYESGMQVGFVD